MEERLARTDVRGYHGVATDVSRRKLHPGSPPRWQASPSRRGEKLAAKTPEGEQDEVANVKAQIARAEAQLAHAKGELSQTTFYAPANGTVVGLTLRPGAMAVPVPMFPALNFIEDEQWILAIYHQNEVRQIKPGQEAEIAFAMYPGRIVKCKVDSIMWATAQGQLPIGNIIASRACRATFPAGCRLRCSNAARIWL